MGDNIIGFSFRHMDQDHPVPTVHRMIIIGAFFPDPCL